MCSCVFLFASLSVLNRISQNVAFQVRAVDDRMGFLTPILKGFLTECGVEAASLGVQVYGGHGCDFNWNALHVCARENIHIVVDSNV